MHGRVALKIQVGEMTKGESKEAGLSVNIPGEALDKAVADVIKTALGETTKGGLQLGGNIFGGLIGDRVREWRTRNLLDTVEKTAQTMKDKGIPLSEAKALPMGHLYSLFEGASKEDDPTLQAMWANLLASGLDPDASDIEVTFFSVLEKMTGRDALLLKYVHGFWQVRKEYWDRKKSIDESAPDRDLQHAQLTENFHRSLKSFSAPLADLSEEQIGESIENLKTLNCIAPHIPETAISLFGKDLMESRSLEAGVSVNTVSPDKIAEEIASLANHVAEVSGIAGLGRLRALASELSDFSETKHRGSFVLTHFGRRFCRVCSGN